MMLAVAADGSNIIEFAGATRRRLKTYPNAVRNACAFRSHSLANFKFPFPFRDLIGARITSISRTPVPRRRRAGGNGGPPLKASPFMTSPSSNIRIMPMQIRFYIFASNIVGIRSILFLYNIYTSIMIFYLDRISSMSFKVFISYFHRLFIFQIS